MPPYTNRVLPLSTNMSSGNPKEVRRKGGRKGEIKEKIEKVNS